MITDRWLCSLSIVILFWFALLPTLASREQQSVIPSGCSCTSLGRNCATCCCLLWLKLWLWEKWLAPLPDAARGGMPPSLTVSPPLAMCNRLPNSSPGPCTTAPPAINHGAVSLLHWACNSLHTRSTLIEFIEEVFAGISYYVNTTRYLSSGEFTLPAGMDKSGATRHSRTPTSQPKSHPPSQRSGLGVVQRAVSWHQPGETDATLDMNRPTSQSPSQAPSQRSA